jgi:hypothetical protein
VALSDHDSLVFSHVITLPVENLIWEEDVNDALCQRDIA